jgi:cytochrome d ubiquinol oxidase subunit II
VAFGNILRGVPIDAGHEYTGGFFTLLNPYALLGGATTLTLFALHGAVFLSLKTDGEIRARARALALRIGVVTVAAAGGFLLWTGLAHHDATGRALSVLAALALVAGLVATWARRDGLAFLGTGVSIVVATFALFVTLFPDVMPSSTSAAYSLTVDNAASTANTLKIMTGVAVVFTPIVLCYQAWTYWVFRKRLRVEDIPPPTGLPARPTPDTAAPPAATGTPPAAAEATP